MTWLDYLKNSKLIILKLAPATKIDFFFVYNYSSPIHGVDANNKPYDFEFSCSGKPCGNNNLSSAVNIIMTQCILHDYIVSLKGLPERSE